MTEPTAITTAPTSGIRSSEHIDQVCAALAQAQGAYPPIGAPRQATIRPREGSPYSFNYASQGDLWAQVRPALAAAGLAVVAGPRFQDVPVEKTGPDGAIITSVVILVTVTSRLVHASGQWLEVDVVVESADGGPRAVAGAISHGRKAGFSCLTGAIPDDDDGDRDRAGDQTPPRTAAPQQRQGSGEAHDRRSIEATVTRLEGLGLREQVRPLLARAARGVSGTLPAVVAAVPAADLTALKAALRRIEHPEETPR